MHGVILSNLSVHLVIEATILLETCHVDYLSSMRWTGIFVVHFCSLLPCRSLIMKKKRAEDVEHSYVRCSQPPPDTF